MQFFKITYSAMVLFLLLSLKSVSASYLNQLSEEEQARFDTLLN